MEDRASSSASPEKGELPSTSFSGDAINLSTGSILDIPLFPVEPPVQGASPLGSVGSPSQRMEAPPWGGCGAASAASIGGAAARPGIPPLGSYTLIDTCDTLSKTLSGVRDNKELRKFHPLCRNFVDYLRWMDSAGLLISGFNNRTNKSELVYKGMSHRWTRLYRNKLLAKLYLLDDYIKENPSEITLMTLTTFHYHKWRPFDDSPRLSIPDAFQVLKKSWKKLSMIIRKHMPGIEYIWIVEPHKSGYPHLHVVLFTGVSVGMQERIKTQWAEYQAGDYDHGAQFEIKKPKNSIESLRNYLMKYIAKGFVSTESRFWNTKWTPAELVFNALVWDGNFRTFQPSRGLSRYMGWTPGKDDAIYWHTNDMQYKTDIGNESASVTIWERSLVGWIPGRPIAEIPGELLQAPTRTKCWYCDKRPENICDCLLVGCS
jgi:hypothetical protein